MVGASGSGKSSLVRAGLVPALMQGALEPQAGERACPPARRDPGARPGRYHIITPGAHPLQALALTLTSDSESVTAAATLTDDMHRDPRSLGLYVHEAGTQAGRGHILLVVDQFEELFTACRERRGTGRVRRQPDDRGAAGQPTTTARP